MEPITQLGVLAGATFQYGFYHFQVYKRALLMAYFPYFKISGLFFTGLYYHSYVTSFASKVKSWLPVSMSSRIDAARDFMSLSPQMRLFTLFPGLNRTETSKLMSPAGGEQSIDLPTEKRGINTRSSQPNFAAVSDFDTTPVDVFEVTLNDLKQFKDEVLEDVQAGAIGGVEKAGLKYLDLTFREPEVHRAILDVLQASLKEKSFIEESRQFGIDMMNEVVKDSEFQKDLKASTLTIVKSDDVKQASTDLLKN